ncbi:MAG: phosphopentomutase [Symbiobacteriia bacterium]
MARKVTLIVFDSVGIGEMPDAAEYGDVGSSTLGNIARARGGLKLPNLAQLGLGNIAPLRGVDPVPAPAGAYGKMAIQSPGKDTMTGHWEMAGIELAKAFRVYPQAFPPAIIRRLEAAFQRQVMGNEVASGTEIIARLGEEHMRTGRPIVYTSADSVLQVAAHQEVIPLEELYRECEAAREIMMGDDMVGRIIARPFVGTPGHFTRTEWRRDYALTPPRKTLLNYVQDAGLPVVAVGKIHDIYNASGIDHSEHTANNDKGIDATKQMMTEYERGLIFTNLVDFDMLYGHRNNVDGYAAALENADRRLPELLGLLGPKDVLVITADHGNDPTTPSTDHSREYVPVLLCGAPIRPGVNLGTRPTLADLGATIADLLGVPYDAAGTSFAAVLRP